MSSEKVPYKINSTGLFINPLIDTPDFSIPHLQTVDSTSLEPYTTADGTNYATIVVPTEDRALSFIPEGGNYRVYDGKIQHPHAVFMDKHGVQYPKVKTDTPSKPKTKTDNSGDKMLMKYYLAGISVVGVLVLARLLVK